MSLSYYALNEEKYSASNLARASRYLAKFYKYNKNEDFELDEEFLDNLKISLGDLVADRYDKRKYRTALKHSKEYINLFGDTLGLHATIALKLVNPNAKLAKVTPQKNIVRESAKLKLDYDKLMADASGLIGTRYKFGG